MVKVIKSIGFGDWIAYILVFATILALLALGDLNPSPVSQEWCNLEKATQWDWAI